MNLGNLLKKIVDAKLDKSGGTMTGTIKINSSSGQECGFGENRTGGSAIQFGVGSGNTNHGVWSTTLNKWMVYADNSNVYLNGTATKATQDGSGNDIVSTYAKKPVTYNAYGHMLNGATASIVGHGVATVTIIGNLARIDFSVNIISASGTSSSDFTWGLNRNLLKSLNSSIPTITPIAGGILNYYAADGYTLDSSMMGNGGTLQASGEFWVPSRNYNTSGTIGKWGSATVAAGRRYIGTCYGTVS